MLSCKKKFTITAIILGLSIILTSCITSNNKNSSSSSEGQMASKKNEEYYMVTFSSGLEYWKNCYKGFQDAGNIYGVKTIYTGAPQYDINEEVTVLEQIIAKRPAGIAVSCINPDAFIQPIKEAMKAGIPVVTFDADSPSSGRYSFLGTGNEYAGSIAAKALYDEIGAKGGDVAVITLPAQNNHEERLNGFKDAIKTNYKNLKLVQVGTFNGEQTEAAKVLAEILQVHPNLKGVFCTDATGGVGAATAVKEANMVGKVKIVSMDTDRGTLDAIKSGMISASIAQGTYSMGYQSMNFIYEVEHNLIKHTNTLNKNNIDPLPPFVDTGVSIVTKNNADSFYTN